MIVLQPFFDWRRALARRRSAAGDVVPSDLDLGLCLGGFESVFFSGGSCVWFMIAAAIIGFRFQAFGKTVGSVGC